MRAKCDWFFPFTFHLKTALISYYFHRKRLNDLAQGVAWYPSELETPHDVVDGKSVMRLTLT